MKRKESIGLNPEDADAGGKLYSRDVLLLLFHYVFRYKKGFFLSFLLVLMIAGANLSVPYLLKTIVDRYVFKEGRIFYLEKYPYQEKDEEVLLNKLLQGVKLEEGAYFLFHFQLKHLSPNERKSLIEEGVLSDESYVLIESPNLGPALGDKLNTLLTEGKAREYDRALFLLKPEVMEFFTVNEVLLLRNTDLKLIFWYICLITVILLVQFGASYFQIYLLMKLSQYAMKDLRMDLYSHILSLEISYFDRNPIGRLVNRVTNDIETLNELFSSVLVTFFQDILMMIGIAVIMFLTDFYLAAVVAITFPIIILLTVLFRIKVRGAYRLIRTKIAELNSFLNETITGIRIIKIFSRQAANLKKFIEKNMAVYDAQLKKLYINAVFRPLIGFLRWFAIAAVIYFGARGIEDGFLSYGILVMFIAYIEKFFVPVNHLSQQFDTMQSATAAGEKIISVFRARAGKEIVPDKAVTARSERFKGEIEFDNVWFSYIQDEWVLKGISFVVKPKQTLGIVGETGAGKTTIINLLQKFYYPQQGQIRIDGKDIKTLSYRQIRENISSVMQDVLLFSRSVRENITLGSAYNKAKFQKVAGITHIERFLENLPAGDLEPVMERGATFSAGERQLLSFARALYFDPAILVLDEATSNIDTETEKLIQDAIIKLTRGRTSIIIAHRLSTIKSADRIIVMDKGRIVEEGNHQTLMKKRGLYYRLYSLQSEALSGGNGDRQNSL